MQVDSLWVPCCSFVHDNVLYHAQGSSRGRTPFFEILRPSAMKSPWRRSGDVTRIRPWDPSSTTKGSAAQRRMISTSMNATGVIAVLVKRELSQAVRTGKLERLKYE